MNNNIPLDALIEDYVKLSVEYGATLSNSEKSKRPDQCFDEIQETFKSIKTQGKIGFDSLSDLMHHKNESVRLWSSFHLLNSPEYNSISVLKAIIDSGSLISLVAEMTLDQWKNGVIKY